MNEQTLKIDSFPDRETARIAGFTVELTDEEAKYLRGLPDHEREDWLHANRARLEKRSKAHATERTNRLGMVLGVDRARAGEDRSVYSVCVRPEQPIVPSGVFGLARALGSSKDPKQKHERPLGAGAKVPGRFKVRK